MTDARDSVNNALCDAVDVIVQYDAHENGVIVEVPISALRWLAYATAKYVNTLDAGKDTP